MAEVTREIVHDKQGGRFISWLALIIALLALALAWMAYNRSGKDLETRVRDQVNQVMNEAEQETEESRNQLNEGNQ